MKLGMRCGRRKRLGQQGVATSLLLNRVEQGMGGRTPMPTPALLARIAPSPFITTQHHVKV
jgi:hypothetical protein